MYFKVLLLCLVSFAYSTSAYSDNVYVVIQKQQEKKKQSRWSLGEWMIQERKIRLMDQWLALNTNEIGAEWKLFYSNLNFERDDSNDTLNGSKYGLELFYGFLGVKYEEINMDEERLLKNTSIQLKLLGSSQQSTHFNVHYGISSSSKDSNPKASFYGYSGDLYFYGGFGYSFLYEEYSADSKTESVYYDALRRENSLFIESGFIRLKYSLFEINYKGQPAGHRDVGNYFGVDLNF